MLSMGRSLHKRLVALPWSERPIRRLPPRMDLMPCRVGSQCPGIGAVRCSSVASAAVVLVLALQAESRTSRSRCVCVSGTERDEDASGAPLTRDVLLLRQTFSAHTPSSDLGRN
jgi:hypothetical protein